MIKNIKEINNFGIYKNFKWDEIENIKNFQKKNIVYGWNYSGKTTISRIFSSLRDKKLHNKFQNASFKILTDSGEITQTRLDTYSSQVFVFNAEYVDDNLKWHNSDKLDAIAFDVGENVAIRNEIEKNTSKIFSIEGDSNTIGRKDKYQIDIDSFNEFESTKYTTEARRIKNDIFNSLIEFNKGHIKNVVTSLTADLSSYILLPDIKNNLKTISIANNDKAEIPIVNFMPKLEELYKKTQDILKDTPSKEEVIERLEENRTLYAWAKEGYQLHAEKHEKCSFCGNTISEDRLEKLFHYFSNESAKLRQAILSILQEINQEILNISNINFPKSVNDMVEACRSDYDAHIKKFAKIKKHYIYFLKQLIKILEKKEDGNLFLPLEIFEFDNDTLHDFNSWHRSLNILLSEHNRIINDFDQEQQAAREKLKQNLVADFLIRENYKEKEKNNDFLKDV